MVLGFVAIVFMSCSNKIDMNMIKGTWGTCFETTYHGDEAICTAMYYMQFREGGIYYELYLRDDGRIIDAAKGVWEYDEEIRKLSVIYKDRDGDDGEWENYVEKVTKDKLILDGYFFSDEEYDRYPDSLVNEYIESISWS